MIDTPTGRALLRSPSPALSSACELTFIKRTLISNEAIAQEHHAYAAALARIGLAVTILPALNELPDSVFVEDNLIVLPEMIILTRPGAPSRQTEIKRIESALTAWAPGVPAARIAAPAILDGGDVLLVGRTLFVGLSARTNEVAISQLRGWLTPYGYRVLPVRVRDCLHLKTGCTPLDDETLLINGAWVDVEEFVGFRQVSVDQREQFAANVLRFGSHCIANEAFPRTLDLVAAYAARSGLRLTSIGLTEFAKAEAGLTCLSAIRSL